MKVLGIDFETTGLDAEKDRIIEIGAVLWDTESGIPLKMQSDFVFYVDSKEGRAKPPLPNSSGVFAEIITSKIEKLTGISSDMLWDHGVPADMALSRLIGMAGRADYLVAHNASFDKEFCRIATKGVIDKHWICTMKDINYPEGMGKGDLTSIAARHGFLNPFAHRALFDVLTMFNIAQKYDWKETIHRSLAGEVTFKAQVDYNNRDKAKEAGFHWDGKKSIWFKTIKNLPQDVERLVGEADEIGFSVVRLNSIEGRRKD